MVPVHVLLPLLCYSPAAAAPRMCTCVATGSVESQVRGALQRADVVFSGTVVEIKYALSPSLPDHPDSRITFVKAVMVPDHSWKGSVTDTIIVWTSANAGTCVFPFQSGEQYLVFASQRNSTGLVTGACTLTQRLAGARRYLRALGKPVRRP